MAIYETIVKWLQTKENFLLITGAAGFGSPVISGKKLRKTDAYIALVKVINEKHNEELDYNGAKSKYDWLLKKFKKAKDLQKAGKDSKLIEETCPFYKELDELYGGRQNVTPSSVLEPVASS